MTPLLAPLLICTIVGVVDGDTIRCDEWRARTVMAVDDTPLTLAESRDVARANLGTPPCGDPVLVVTDLPPDRAGEADLAACTIRIDWTVPPEGACWLLAHEWGHLTGLGHAPDRGSIMYGGDDPLPHPWCVRPPEPTVEIAARTVRVRLAGIDAPETRPPCRWVGCCGGPEARARLRELLPIGTEVRVRQTAVDRYGRRVGYVWTGRTPATARSSVNYRMVREGWARFYAAYPGLWPSVFAAGEARAQREERGMWRWTGRSEH